MAMTNAQLLMTIGVAALATIITRFLPFVLFPGNKKTPEFILYLGKVLAPAVFGMLIIYCLRSVDVLGGSHGIPEAIAIAVTAGLHLWRKNMMLSIAGGTVCYMLLVQLVFV